MRASKGPAGLLLRHDGRIAINVARANLAGWQDRLTAAAIVIGALAILRTRFAELPWDTAKWAVAAAGTMFGFGVANPVRARLDWHAFDGLLAAEALRPPARRNYGLAWHGLANALLVAILCVVRPSLLIVAIIAYLVGMLAARLVTGVTMPRMLAGRIRPGRASRAWLHRPHAGLAGALLLIVSLFPARTLGINALMAVTGVETLLLALALTNVDDAIVRFMAISGHDAPNMILKHAKSLVVFTAMAVPGSWLGIGPAASILVGAVSLAALLLLALRILAYRLYKKRFADLMLSILAGMLALTAFMMPIALPLVAIAMLWHLQRRARARTWLIA